MMILTDEDDKDDIERRLLVYEAGGHAGRLPQDEGHGEEEGQRVEGVEMQQLQRALVMVLRTLLY
jgi:hypothetical protein